MIQPTVGRMVWYYEAGSTEETQPLSAQIAAVWGDRWVNLMVIGKNGVPMSHPPTSVRLVQVGEGRPKQVDGTFARHCTWMPYQIGQAAKYAAEAGK